MKLRLGVLAFGLVGTLCAQEDLRIKSAHVHTMGSQGTLAATIVVSKGKVASVGNDAATLDLGDAHIYPGFVDAATAAGARRERDDLSKTILPEFKMRDAVELGHRDFQSFASHGVTTVHVLPGDRNVVGGLATAIKIGGADGASWLKPVTGLKVSLRESEYAPPRGGGGGDPFSRMFGGGGAAGRDPTSLFGGLSLLRSPPKESAEAMAPWKDGKSRVFVAAGSNREYDAAARLRSDAGLNPTVIASAGAGARSKELAAGASGLILSPIRPGMDGYAAKEIADLFASTMPIAFCSAAPFTRPSSLRVSASTAVMCGADVSKVERALTIDAARLVGVDDRVGSLEVGKDGDLVALSGPATDSRSRVLLVVSDGRVIWRAEKDSKP